MIIVEDDVCFVCGDGCRWSILMLSCFYFGFSVRVVLFCVFV